MSQLAPPKAPPRVAAADGDGLHRLNFRLWQVDMAKKKAMGGK